MAILRALHSTVIALAFRRGLRAMVDAFATYANAEGEPAYTTDVPALWIADSAYRFQLVPDLRQAVTNDGEVVVNDGEVVWHI